MWSTSVLLTYLSLNLPLVLGSVGGFIGWISLACLVDNEDKQGEDISASIKVGLCGFTLRGLISPGLLLSAITPAILFTILVLKMRNHNRLPVQELSATLNEGF